MLPIFVGVDSRQPIAFTALVHSIMWRSTKPVSVTPLNLEQLPITRRGLTEFTYSRFLVPYLMGFKGTALFLDADMIVKGDISELFSLADGSAVQVVKNPRRFEWPSLMLFNCEKCRGLTPEFVEDEKNSLFDFAWAESIGDLPAEWNHCIGYDEPKEAKLLHYTSGIPIFDEVQKFGYQEEWKEAHRYANASVKWEDLMGASVHKEIVNA